MSRSSASGSGSSSYLIRFRLPPFTTSYEAFQGLHGEPGKAVISGMSCDFSDGDSGKTVVLYGSCRA